MPTYTGPNVITIVDANQQEVGFANDPLAGVIYRRVGDDLVAFLATSAGPTTGPIYFFHTTADCSGARYFPISGGSGFAFPAAVHRGAFFYTKTDPNVAPPLDFVTVEYYDTNEDAVQQSKCDPVDPFSSSLGVVTTAVDPLLPNLALPLRVK